MKLSGTIAVHGKGEAVLRAPRFWDKVKRVFGGEPDLRTGNTRAALEASALVDAVRGALTTLGATNAVSLVVDDLVLFQDRDGRPDDLGDLFLAFHEQSAAIGGAFELLRLAVEHVEAGLHLVIEVQARGEHPEREAAVRVVIAGRVQAFEPKKGEDAAAYQARVAPLLADKTAIDVARLQFESFVARVRDAVHAAMPEARVELERAQAQVQRPGREPARQVPPTAPGYDPYVAYYPSPLDGVLNMMLWTSIFSMAMHPDVVVVDHHGDTVGHVDTPGIEHGDPGIAEVGDTSDVADASAVSDGVELGSDVDVGGVDVGDGGGFDFGDFGGFD